MKDVSKMTVSELTRLCSDVALIGVEDGMKFKRARVNRHNVFTAFNLYGTLGHAIWLTRIYRAAFQIAEQNKGKVKQ
jgi:hypothetical protein